MANRITNYYIGLQIAVILTYWLANGATGIHFSNVFTQILVIETLVLTSNSFLLYRNIYIKASKLQRNLLYLSLPLSGIVFAVRSVTILWNGFVVFQLPFHFTFLFGFFYSFYLFFLLVKFDNNTSANKAFTK